MKVYTLRKTISDLKNPIDKTEYETNLLIISKAVVLSNDKAIRDPALLKGIKD